MTREYAIVLTDLPGALLHPGDRVEIIGKAIDNGDTMLLTQRGSVEYVDPSAVGADTPYNRHQATCKAHRTRHSPEGFSIVETCDCGARFHHHPNFSYPITLR